MMYGSYVPGMPGVGAGRHTGAMDGFDLAVIGAGLPMAARLGEVADAIGTRRAAVVEAPPGTGKTTVIPPAIANLVPGRVVVTQPRRVAARAAARRLATLAGTAVGREVGFSVRGESRVSPATRVEFVTPGVLVRRLVADPDLSGVGAVVLDEVHERHLDSDLAFAMVREVLELRDDLVVVAMSATVDAQRWAGLLGVDAPAPVVSVPALAHPLTISWQPPPPGVARLDHRGVTHAFLDHVAAATEGAWDPAGQGNALVFLPGSWEVGQVVDRLRARMGGAGVEVLPLSGQLDARAQDAVLAPTAPGAARRVIVSTAVAESSLTVPGVRMVVDAGLVREPRPDAARGIAGLVTLTESRAAAEQRAGRAARLGPGVAVRCLAAEDWARMDAYPVPHIATADLTAFALDVACWGAPGAEGLVLPDPPPRAAMDRATRTLRHLGAIRLVDGPDGGVGAVEVTERGRRMARVPADPRQARALLDGAGLVGRRAAAEVVALVADDVRVPGADLVAGLRAMRSGTLPQAGRWRSEAKRLTRLLSAYDAPGPAGDAAGATDAEVGTIVALAHPEWIARRRGGPGSTSYTLAGGTGASLPRDARLVGQEWLAVADLGRARTGAAGVDGAIIRAAAPISETDALAAGRGLLSETEQATWARGKVTARRVRALGAIELSATPVRPSREAARAAVREAIASRGLGLGASEGSGEGVFTWSAAGRGLARRLHLLHHTYGEPWPSMAEDALLARWAEWLAPEIDALVDGRAAAGLDMTSALRRLLPWPQASRLDELVPERLEVPTGSRVRIDYPPLDDPGARPVVAVKLQECFGWTDTPTVCEGRVPILLHLLSPAQRPLAITDDLASFWENAYPQVRAENRGRYAKHPWPEDPMAAPPRRGTTRSGR